MLLRGQMNAFLPKDISELVNAKIEIFSITMVNLFNKKKDFIYLKSSFIEKSMVLVSKKERNSKIISIFAPTIA